MSRIIEDLLILLVRKIEVKKCYSLAWKYSQWLVNRKKEQKRVARTRLGFFIQGNLDDYLFRSIYFTGKYEQEVISILDGLVRNNQTWIDLGSNIGFFSLYFAKNAKRVFSVDANPGLIELLEETRQLNKFNNMVLINHAVSDVSQQDVEFYISEQEPGRSSMLRYDDIPEVKKIKVTTITVDQIIEQYGVLPFGLKIDIEGLEICALRGARTLLSHSPPKVIVMELSQREGVLANPAEIISFLREFCYSPFIIRGKKLLRIQDAKDIDIEMDPNAFFVHESYVSSLPFKQKTAR